MKTVPIDKQNLTMTPLFRFVCAIAFGAVLGLAGCIKSDPPNGGDGNGGASQGFVLGGNVTGLVGTALVLQNHGGDDLVLNGNGPFTYYDDLRNGDDYDITVAAQPGNPAQTCTVINGTGVIANANVDNVEVSCAVNTYFVGGNVAGLTGSGLVLQNNDGDDLTPGNGAFLFATPIPSGGDYDVRVAAQPSNPGQTCTVVNGTGTVGSSNIAGVQVNCATDSYTVGGTIAGLTGSGLRLQLNDVVTLLIGSGSTGFTLPFPLSSGALYNVTVFTQPGGQTCSVTNGTGTIESANVTDVSVSCIATPPPAPPFTVGGSVAGLAGSGLVLRNNGGDDLAIAADGAFTFPTALTDGSAYNVTVATQPGSPAQTCAVTSGSGNIGGANVTNVTVNCTTNLYTVGGSITGLSGSGLILQNNGGNNLSIGGDGTFTFTTALAGGSAYNVTVATSPTNPAQTCTVSNGSGTIGSANVTSVSISCTTNSYTIGGSVSGLSGSGLVLRNNGGDDLLVNANGVFTFLTPVLSGNTYNVTVRTQPSSPAQTCTVTGGAGTVAAANVTSVAISCSTFTVGGNVTGLSGTVVLQNNGADNLTLSANGAFTFATPLADGAGYNVSVATHPSGQTCTVTNGTGTINSASATNVAVSCAATPAAPSLSVSFGIKQLRFSWTAVSGCSTYQLWEDANGTGSFTQIGGGNLGTTSYNHDVAVYRHNWASARYRVNCVGGPNSNQVGTAGAVLSAIGYFKASNTNANDKFGHAIGLSTDGLTLAVGALNEDSCATGINGSQSNNSCADSGAVYVFVRNASGTWSQQAYIKAHNTEAGDFFGRRLGLSGDGNTLAVAAPGEDSSQDGVHSTPPGDDDTAAGSGAVYVFTRSGTTWSQQAYIKAHNTGAGDEFGEAVALSGDGSTLAVGAYHEDSDRTGIMHAPFSSQNNSAVDSGAVYVFTRSGSAWSQQAYVKASNTGADDLFGAMLALNGNGNTLAVGARNEDSCATGIGGSQSSNACAESGAVYVFVRSGSTWSQQAYVKASNTEAGDAFGDAVALSDDGSTLAVGARNEDSAATGIGGSQGSNAASNSGAAYLFTRSGSAWSQQAYIKASNTEAGDRFGVKVALSSDGNTLAVGADSEDSSATGVGGSQTSNSVSGAGAVYMLVRNGSTWSQRAYVKASNTEANDNFGRDLALSGDGNTLAVRGSFEDSSATGIGGNQGDNSAVDAGAVYLY